jgi:large repetitive protein
MSNAVRIELKDAMGTPVADRTQLTLALTGMSANAQTPARILTPDQNPNEDGVQVFATDGSIDIQLAGPDSPASARLSVEAGTIKHHQILDFLPALRPLLGVGVIDGAIQLHKLKASQLSNNGRSSFDQELQCLGQATLSIASQAGQWDCFHKEFAQGKGQADLTTALYFKGEVKGDYLLTLAYDSAKDVKARVFRDIAPDQFYPIYGDASQRGYDANSTEKLYLRVDKGGSFVLYGDFTTASAQASRQLSQYSRSLTGVRTKLGDASNQIEAFATRDSLKQKVIDIPANGTGGPFELGTTGVINSEKIEVLTRSRQSNQVVLSRKLLTRFVDYEIEMFTGRLLLRAPLPSLDADLNPISLHIVLEQEDEKVSFWTAGIQGHVTPTPGVEMGGVAVKSFQPQAQQSLMGAYATVEINPNSAVTIEAAKSQQDKDALTTSGKAIRLEFSYKLISAVEAKIYAQKVDPHFDNPSASALKGRTELGGHVNVPVNANLTVGAEYLQSHDEINHLRTQGMLLKTSYQLSEGFKIEAGIRHANQHSDGAQSGSKIDDAFTSARLKTTAALGAQASAYAELEQAINDRRRQLFAVGAEYRLANKGRLYTRHEIANTLNSEFALTPTNKAYNTVLGVDAPVMDNTQAFSEYRLKEAIGGKDAQAAFGLRQTWLPGSGVRLNTSLERTHILSTAPGAVDAGPSTSATVAGQYTAALDWKANARLEWRDTRTQTNWLNTVGAAYKINQNWSALIRSTLSLQSNHTSNTSSSSNLSNTANPGTSEAGVTNGTSNSPSNTAQSRSDAHLNKYRVQLGVAYRDEDRDQWHGLAKVEQRGEQDTTLGLALKRSVTIASGHIHYQLKRDWWVSSSVALKRAKEDSNQLANHSTGALLAARLNWDICNRWDMGVRFMASKSSDNSANKQTKLGLGVELGYMLEENTWLSLGYNVWGVKDKDLTNNEYTEAGWYLRLRYKFDETLFNAAQSSKSAQKSQP